jgi:hypothetical protein
MALPPEEQQMVARTRKTRKFFVFLRERRHDILDTDLQNTLAQSYSPAPGGASARGAGAVGPGHAVASLLQWR